VIDDAEKQGLIRPYTGSRIFEGTVGSTGISIATIARARCVIYHYVFCSNSAVVRGYDTSMSLN
jgi:cysteine synthase